MNRKPMSQKNAELAKLLRGLEGALRQAAIVDPRFVRHADRSAEHARKFEELAQRPEVKP